MNLEILREIGIEPWISRARIEQAHRDFDNLRQKVSSCHSCKLSSSRTNVVFGVGNEEAELLIIGEAPGRDEDLQGEPFVGRAGKLLDEMLKAIGLNRNLVYIANILKCRPPDNRDPEISEIKSCIGFLKAQIKLIKPKVILCLGRIAAQNLLEVNLALGKLRGKIHSCGDIPVIVSYHPAYLLRSPKQKAQSWIDLKEILKHL